MNISHKKTEDEYNLRQENGKWDEFFYEAIKGSHWVKYLINQK
jgi:hypothetical protein